MLVKTIIVICNLAALLSKETVLHSSDRAVLAFSQRNTQTQQHILHSTL